MSNKDLNNSQPESDLKVINISKTDIIVADNVLWAGTSEQRRKGLLGKDELDPYEGIYIVPSGWIHTFGMKFPIDVAFLSKKGEVLAIHHSLKPNRLSKLIFRAEGVLELSSGRLKASNTEVGDILTFV